MAKFVLKRCRLFTGGIDLTTRNNQIELGAEVEEKDVTTFSPDDVDEVWREVIAGLATTSASGEGQWEAGDPGMVDDALWAARGGVGAWTACPDGAAVGDLAWLTQMFSGSYELGGQVGDVAPWKAGWSGSWPLVRGQVLHAPGTPRTAAGTGIPLQFGPLTEGQALYLTLHVVSAAGTGAPSLTVAIESDAASDMAAATTRASFAPAGEVGGQAVRVAGPVDDGWWRITWDVAGVEPSVLFVVAAGIGPA